MFEVIENKQDIVIFFVYPTTSGIGPNAEVVSGVIKENQDVVIFFIYPTTGGISSTDKVVVGL